MRAFGCFKKDEETLRYRPGALMLGVLPLAVDGAAKEVCEEFERMVVRPPFELPGGFVDAGGDLMDPPKLIFEK